MAAQRPGAAAGLSVSSAILPAALEGRAALNQEAAGTKGPLRVQHGVTAALCLILAYLLSTGFIVPRCSAFTASPSTTAAIKPRGLQLGIKCWSSGKGCGGEWGVVVVGTNAKGPWHVPADTSWAARWSIPAPKMCPAWQGPLQLTHFSGHGAPFMLSPPDSSFDPNLPISRGVHRALHKHSDDA